ncbi:phage tail protein [Fundidesulfovibrio soli]|uniref:phage tail protein n=1 Tax=Fundidesulfovibrio soli TaxID=2922716 RepID=UPI001FAFBDDE|nr:phage tail protein [Fundidesulfovibrio soli]
MTFTRTTLIDASPSGDSVKQAVLDLDADLTGAFAGLNQLLASLGGKISQGDYNQPQGVPRLDASAKIPAGLLPSLLAEGPVGMIAAFGVQTLPSGSNWLECNGAELALAEYPALYAAIGTSFGFASDPAKFRLPDLRGTFLRGWDHNAHVDPDAASRTRGDTVGSSQADCMQKHCHPAGWERGEVGGGLERGLDPGTRTAGVGWTHDFDQAQITTAELQAGNIWGGFAPTGLETRPKNTAVMFCIKWR